MACKRQMQTVLSVFLGIAASSMSQVAQSQPLEKVKVAIGFISLWDSQQVELCKERGDFKKAGLDVETIGTRGGSETVQAVVAGGMDIGFSVGINSVLAALEGGAKIKIISSEFIGQNDVLIYVAADSPIKKPQDLAGKLVGFARPGTAIESVLLALKKRENIDFKMTATGAPDATRTLVMTRQIHAGYTLPPFGLAAEDKGEIRILFAGDEVDSMRNITNRVVFADSTFLQNRRPVAVKFLQVLDQCIDWAYANLDEATKKYASVNKVSGEAAAKGVTYYSRQALSFGKLREFDKAQEIAVDGKFIKRPFTADELNKFVDIVYETPKK